MITVYVTIYFSPLIKAPVPWNYNIIVSRQFNYGLRNENPSTSIYYIITFYILITKTGIRFKKSNKW